MNANLFFRDIFAHIDGGVHAQTLAAGTTSGSAIPLNSTWNKLVFRLLYTKGTANAGLSMYLQTATASNGTFTSISQTLTSISVSVTSAGVLEIDTRGEAFANLAGTTAPTWVQPVVVVATTATPLALDVLGWSNDYEPAKKYDGAGIVVTETDFY